MDRDDGELRALVQAQKVEIEELKAGLENTNLDNDKNRTAARERPLMGKKPNSAEGKDADHRFMEDGGKTYYTVKVNGKWKKMEVTDV